MKERLDVLLVKQGFAPSREKAKAILMSGIVYVDGQKEDKAGTMFDPEKIKIEVRGNTLPYVSSRRTEAGKSIAGISDRSTGKDLSGYLVLPPAVLRIVCAPEWSRKGICGGCRTWTA